MNSVIHLKSQIKKPALSTNKVNNEKNYGRRMKVNEVDVGINVIV